MTLRVFFGSLLAVVLSMCASGLSYAADWPEPPSRLRLETPYGVLHVSQSDYIYESRLLIDGTATEPLVKGQLNIPYAFSASNSYTALVSINDGSRRCPVHYRWMKINSDGHTLSEPFGSCNERIKVKTKGSQFTLITPNENNPAKVDVYTYNGRTITSKLAQ